MRSQIATAEATIFSRLIENGAASLTSDVARYIIRLQFSDDDTNRMHELAVKNQNGELSISQEKKNLRAI